MSYAVEVRGLWWRYEGRAEYALRGVDLRVERGEIVGIMGPSGAGKTTLCLALNGIIPQRIPGEFRGEVRVFGRSTLERDVSEVARDVGLVLEDPEVQFVMSTVEDEVVLGLEALDLPREEMEERLRWALELVDLPPSYLGKRPLELSGGEKQRVAIASIVAMRPRLLVLDEPTSDLDPRGKEEVLRALWRVREELGITIVVVEHESEFLAEFADRLVVLSGGRVVMEGAPEEVLSRADEVKRHGVRPPQVAELGYSLGMEPLPLTLSEFVERFSESFSEADVVPAEVERKPATRGPPVIECEGVSYAYPDGTRALRGVDLTVGRGEFLAVVGPNGSGKTTLAKVLCGLLRPSGGRVFVFGEEPWKAPRRVMCRRIGYVFQNPDHQLFCSTVYDELAFGLRWLGASEGEVRERVERLLDVLRLRGLEREHPFFLSKGERRRLALGSVLALEPEVLIVDEPTTGQDHGMCVEIMELLREYNRAGRTVVLISHSIPLIVDYVDRLVVMRSGRVVADGDPHDVLSMSDVVEEAHLTVPQVTLASRALRERGYSLDPSIVRVSEFLSRVRPQVRPTAVRQRALS